MSHLITGLLVPVTFCRSTENLRAMLVVKELDFVAEWEQQNTCRAMAEQVLLQSARPGGSRAGQDALRYILHSCIREVARWRCAWLFASPLYVLEFILCSFPDFIPLWKHCPELAQLHCRPCSKYWSKSGALPRLNSIRFSPRLNSFRYQKPMFQTLCSLGHFLYFFLRGSSVPFHTTQGSYFICLFYMALVSQQTEHGELAWDTSKSSGMWLFPCLSAGRQRGKASSSLPALGQFKQHSCPCTTQGHFGGKSSASIKEEKPGLFRDTSAGQKITTKKKKSERNKCKICQY